MIRYFLGALLGASLGFIAHAGDLPDQTLTPGALNPDVTQDNIQATICVPGWTKTIRPPASYTNKLKGQQMAERGLDGDPSLYEEDHLISLEIGGAPREPANLWPQLWNAPSGWGAHKKDVIETKLKHLVCAGTISLAEAQDAIRNDWTATYKKYVGAAP